MLVQTVEVPFSSPQIIRMFLLPGAACCGNAGGAERRLESPTAAMVNVCFLVIIPLL